MPSNIFCRDYHDRFRIYGWQVPSLSMPWATAPLLFSTSSPLLSLLSSPSFTTPLSSGLNPYTAVTMLLRLMATTEKARWSILVCGVQQDPICWRFLPLEEEKESIFAATRTIDTYICVCVLRPPGLDVEKTSCRYQVACFIHYTAYIAQTRSAGYCESLVDLRALFRLTY